MTYAEYIAYHKRGDASIEERLCARLCQVLGLDEWNSFRFIYLYCTLYHIPSVIDLVRNPATPKSQLTFRTDRKWVRYSDTYERLVAGLVPEKMERLKGMDSTQAAYDYVSSWFYFGRYAAYLFLEVYLHRWKDRLPVDDFRCGWEKGENYTNGAILLAGSRDRAALDALVDNVRRDTGDNAFCIETSLCAVWKMHRHRNLFEGYCAERTMKIAAESKYKNLLLPLIA